MMDMSYRSTNIEIKDRETDELKVTVTSDVGANEVYFHVPVSDDDTEEGDPYAVKRFTPEEARAIALALIVHADHAEALG